MRKSAFAPVVAGSTRVLVLGSLPGERSLAAGRYYAHPRNLFWRLIGGVMGQDLEALAYEVRLQALLSAGIGVWDTIASAHRAGSLDSAIRDLAAAELCPLLRRLPGLRAIAFNGRKSAAIGRRAIGPTELALLDLPSSSPANAGIAYEEKARQWGKLRDFL